MFHCEHFLIRFKKYKQAGSHSNSFRLSNGRTEDVGKTPLNDMGDFHGEENQENRSFPILKEKELRAALVFGRLARMS